MYLRLSPGIHRMLALLEHKETKLFRFGAQSAHLAQPIVPLDKHTKKICSQSRGFSLRLIMPKADSGGLASFASSTNASRARRSWRSGRSAIHVYSKLTEDALCSLFAFFGCVLFVLRHSKPSLFRAEASRAPRNPAPEIANLTWESATRSMQTNVAEKKSAHPCQWSRLRPRSEPTPNPLRDFSETTPRPPLSGIATEVVCAHAEEHG